MWQVIADRDYAPGEQVHMSMFFSYTVFVNLFALKCGFCLRSAFWLWCVENVTGNL